MENPFKSQLRVFVVDDEPEIAKMMAVILQMNLFDAVPFFDPDSALAAADTELPDYLITDVVMPGMNGIDLAIAMQQKSSACKVLLFSGQVGAPELLHKAVGSGHRFDFAQKPIHPKVLVETLLKL